MTTYCAESMRARCRRAAGLLAATLLCAVPALAQNSEHLALRDRIETRYEVVATGEALSLRARSDTASVRLIEITDRAISIDGTAVTGGELRDRLGEEADLILQLSYLDADDREDLFERDSNGRRRVGGRFQFGESITVDADELVARDVVAIGGSIRVFGEVRGSVVAIGGNVDLGPDAVVNRDVVVIGGSLDREPGARVNGEVHDVSWRGINVADWNERRAFDIWPGPALGSVIAFVSTVGRLAILTLFALVVVLLGRDYVEMVGTRAAAEPLKAGAVGVLSQLLFLPLLVITIVMLVITIIGIPLLVLIPFVLLGLIVVSLVGFTAVAQQIGRLITGRFGWSSGPYATTCAGIVLILSPVLLARMASMIGRGMFPMTMGLGVFGAILEYLVWTIGFGAVAIAWLASRRNRPVQPVG